MAATLLDGTGRQISLKNEVRRIDEDGVAHALNRHEGDKIPLTREDLAHIPDVVQTGEIVSAAMTDLNLPGVTYRKMIDGRWLYVVEEAHGASKTAPTMVMKTAYWNNGPKNKPGAEAPDMLTPERSASSSQTSKPFSVVRVNDSIAEPQSPGKSGPSGADARSQGASPTLRPNRAEGTAKDVVADNGGGENTLNPRAAEPPAPAIVRATIEEMDAMRPVQEQALYRDVQRIVEENPDRMIDFEEHKPDGSVTSGTATVREVMEAADDDIRAIEAFRACAVGRKT